MDGERLLGWIGEDTWRMDALYRARDLALPDWCLAAGFVRNLVWDRLHDYVTATPLNDIDLVFFDPEEMGAERDRALTRQLQIATGAPWSAKNQARMHLRHDHAPYASTADAMRFWVERETAVGVSLDSHGCLGLIAPLGVESLLAGRVTHNPLHADSRVFLRRIAAKGWRERWPLLEIVDP